jgi:hypothetical protein
MEVSDIRLEAFAATESVPETLGNFHTSMGLSVREVFFGGAWLASLPGHFTTGKVSRCPLIPQHAWTFWGREKLLTTEADKEKCSKELMKIVHRIVRTT